MSLRLMTWRSPATFVVALLLCTLLADGTARADPTEAKKIFEQRCTACHTFGKGVKVGPDLKGVTERRTRPWLQRFIRSSQTVISEGDPTATALFQQFKQQQMPDWTDLSEAQITSLLDWFAAGGPAQRDPNSRTAAEASAQEIERGRRLFLGELTFTAGGLSCAACHSMSGDSGLIGASLASDLSSAYAEYQDGGMTQALQRPCTRRFPEAVTPSFLTPEEIFALKAYLRSRTRRTAEAPTSGAALGAAKAVDRELSPPGDSPPGTAPAAAAPMSPAQPRDHAPRWRPRIASIGTAPHGLAPINASWIFTYVPYVAAALFVLGMLLRWRFNRARPHPPREAAAAASAIYGGGRPWRVGLGLVLVLHLLMLLAPRAVVWWASAPLGLLAFEAGGWLLGALAFVGWAQITWRYLERAAVDAGERARELDDALVLAMLGLALGSGLILAVADRWASLWATGTLTPYLRSLPTGTPLGGVVEQLPLFVRLHVLSWFALLAALPASRVADVLLYGVDRAAHALSVPLDAGLRALARVRSRVQVARWIWPEEDDEPSAKSEAGPMPPNP